MTLYDEANGNDARLAQRTFESRINLAFGELTVTEKANFAPFPPLLQQGGRWEAPLSVPWFTPKRLTTLVVEGYASNNPRIGNALPPAPSAAQTEAFHRIVAADSTLPETLLAHFRETIPDFADQDWDDAQSVFRLEQLTVLRPEHAGEAYIGIAFSCLLPQYGYEEGIGVILHKERIVHAGFADEANDDGTALKDLRRIARVAK
jgi:hypothetical protein